MYPFCPSIAEGFISTNKMSAVKTNLLWYSFLSQNPHVNTTIKFSTRMKKIFSWRKCYQKIAKLNTFKNKKKQITKENDSIPGEASTAKNTISIVWQLPNKRMRAATPSLQFEFFVILTVFINYSCCFTIDIHYSIVL